MIKRLCLLILTNNHGCYFGTNYKTCYYLRLFQAIIEHRLSKKQICLKNIRPFDCCLVIARGIFQLSIKHVETFLWTEIAYVLFKHRPAFPVAKRKVFWVHKIKSETNSSTKRSTITITKIKQPGKCAIYFFLLLFIWMLKCGFIINKNKTFSFFFFRHFNFEWFWFDVLVIYFWMPNMFMVSLCISAPSWSMLAYNFIRSIKMTMTVWCADAFIDN